MSEALQFGRVITALITPFDEQLNIDFTCFQKLAQRQFEHGVQAVVICGTTGESPTLSHKEKFDLFKAAQEVASDFGPDAKIIANIGTNNTADSVASAKEATELGVDALMAVAPYYNKPPQEGLYQHFSAIARATDCDIMLYNIPGRCSITIEPQTIVRLAQNHANITMVKQAVSGLEDTRYIIEHAPQGFQLYSGNDDQTVDIMNAGGVGVVSTTSNVLPHAMVQLCNLVAQGDSEKASHQYQALSPLMDGLFVAPNPIMVKAALQHLGYNVGGVRLPLVCATPQERAFIEGVLADLPQDFC